MWFGPACFMGIDGIPCQLELTTSSRRAKATLSVSQQIGRLVGALLVTPKSA